MPNQNRLYCVMPSGDWFETLNEARDAAAELRATGKHRKVTIETWRRINVSRPKRAGETLVYEPKGGFKPPLPKRDFSSAVGVDYSELIRQMEEQNSEAAEES